MKKITKIFMSSVLVISLFLSGCNQNEDVPDITSSEDNFTLTGEIMENFPKETEATAEITAEKTALTTEISDTQTKEETTRQTEEKTSDTKPSDTAKTEETAASPATSEDKIQDIISQMSLEEKIGQIILVRYSSNTAAKADKFHFGGYTLYAVDFENETPDSIKAKLAPLYDNSTVAPFIAADEEGGSVIRISKYQAFSSSPLPAIGSSSAKSDINAFAANLSEIMKKGGVNLTLSPVADVAESPDDYIYSRTCKENYEETGRLIAQIVTELNSKGSMCCLKHFPGYGSNVDTHTGIAIDERTAENFESKDFIPFKAGIEAGAPMVMINHNIVTAYNSKVPASLAPEIHIALRNLGFNGIIVTDDLGMGAITKYSDDPYADAVLAGNDLLCTSDGENCFNSLYNAVKEGKITEKRLDESIYRILKAKQKYGILSLKGE